MILITISACALAFVPEGYQEKIDGSNDIMHCKYVHSYEMALLHVLFGVLFMCITYVLMGGDRINTRVPGR